MPPPRAGITEHVPSRALVHEVRMARDGRYVCTARGCVFAGTLPESLQHVSGRQFRVRYSDEAAA